MTKLILNEATNKSAADYADAYSSAFDKDEVVNDFLASFEKNYNLKLSIDLKNTIAKQIDDLSGGEQAFNYLTNPFLQFLVKYAQLNGKEAANNFSSTSYNTLFQLLGDGVINEDNLKGVGPQGLEDVIFVPDVYNHKYNETKYLCQAFYWLNDNVRQLNLTNLLNSVSNNNSINSNDIEESLKEAMDDNVVKVNGIYLSPDQAQQIKDQTQINKQNKLTTFLNTLGANKDNLTASTFANPKDTIKFILFDDNNPRKFREPSKIYKAMDYLDSIRSDLGVKTDTNKSDINSIKKSILDKATTKKYNDMGINPNNMTVDNAKQLIKYLVNTFKINL